MHRFLIYRNHFLRVTGFTTYCRNFAHNGIFFSQCLTVSKLIAHYFKEKEEEEQDFLVKIGEFLVYLRNLYFIFALLFSFKEMILSYLLFSNYPLIFLCFPDFKYFMKCFLKKISKHRSAKVTRKLASSTL